MSKILIAVLLLCSVICLTQAKLKVNPQTKQIVDEQGNTVILHGVNVAYKISPFLPPNTKSFNFDNSFSAEDADRLRSWGMNSIRLTIYWEAVEPVRGKYNDAYLSKVEEIVDICAKRGIYVYLDAHQDVANKQFCGEGMPDWAIKPANALNKFPAPLFNLKFQYDKDGYPTLESCLKNNFPIYYMTYAVEDAYQNLFSNWNGIGDAFANMWAHVASRFKDKQNLIGYEIINEPWVGNLYKNPGIAFKTDQVMKFYNRVHNAVRKVDDQSIIFFEHPLTDAELDAVHGSPGGPDYNDRQILSYHVYAIGMGDPQSTKVVNSAASKLYGRVYQRLDRENLTGFLTEFGAISGLTQPGNDHIKYVLDLADNRMQSWSYWQYKYYEDYTTAARPSVCEGFFDDKGNVITEKIRVLSRPYVQLSSLPILEMRVSTTYALSVTFKKDSSNKKGLVKLYLNEDLHFTEGAQCSTKQCPSCSVLRSNSENKHHFELDYTQAPVGELQLMCSNRI